MLVGYARVFTDDQHLDLQLDALRREGCDRIYFDQGISGAAAHRPALDDALAVLAPGDVLVIWKLDRLGRSLSHLLSLANNLQERAISLKSLTDAIDTSTPGGRLQFHLMGALAEFERSLISERTKAGMAAARARGAAVGRPTKLSPSVVIDALTSAQGKPLAEVARNLCVSLSTLRRAIYTTRDDLAV